MGSILSIGECMIEMADLGHGTYRRGFAGDTFNTAWYMRRLLPRDWTVAYGTCIGDDAASENMRDFIANSGIATDWMRAVPQRSVGLYMIDLDQGERHFSYWRSQSAARLLADDPTWLAEMMQGQDVIYVSGITMAILLPHARETLCNALANARSNGATIAFDTNLRPELWENVDTMRHGMTQAAHVADIVLPSFDEETILFNDTSPIDTITRYQSLGARVVVVKNGADEITLADDHGIQTIQPQNIGAPVDTTAAGDSFGGAFLAARAMGHTNEQAAIMGSKIAAQVVQSHGALVPVTI